MEDKDIHFLYKLIILEFCILSLFAKIEELVVSWNILEHLKNYK